ncbi:excalibur calcium-binding domain-containing protein [Agrococcus citreus]|uniref:Excalibur calcium-binding domain-containing protein n=1 Tax=Agrococcus citreus TaxID=84643 RepID=A0ABN1YVY7_9MICO
MKRNVPNPMARFRSKRITPLTEPLGPVFAGAVHESAAPERQQQRSKRFWIVLGLLALVALLLSNCAGRATSGSEFDARQQAVAEELGAALIAQERAETEARDLEREVRELEPQAGEVETLQASLEDERAAVVTMQQERDDALAAVAELQSRIASLEADAAAVPARPAPVAQPQPAAQPAPAAAPAAAAHYANCAAARAAGAAPLRAGSPGYRSGLDRDGDGVACES